MMSRYLILCVCALTGTIEGKKIYRKVHARAYTQHTVGVIVRERGMNWNGERDKVARSCIENEEGVACDWKVFSTSWKRRPEPKSE